MRPLYHAARGIQTELVALTMDLSGEPESRYSDGSAARNDRLSSHSEYSLPGESERGEDLAEHSIRIGYRQVFYPVIM